MTGMEGWKEGGKKVGRRGRWGGRKGVGEKLVFDETIPGAQLQIGIKHMEECTEKNKNFMVHWECDKYQKLLYNLFL